MIAMRELAGAIALVAIAVGASAQAWIPIEVTHGHITFPAIIEGVATRAALDTGANVNSIDAGFAERAGFKLSGLRFKIRSAHLPGKIVASEAELDVELFGVKATLRDTPALHHPSAPLNLGANFLEPFVLQIDYPNSRMRILARAAFDLAKYDNVQMRKAEGSCEP